MFVTMDPGRGTTVDPREIEKAGPAFVIGDVRLI